MLPKSQINTGVNFAHQPYRCECVVPVVCPGIWCRPRRNHQEGNLDFFLSIILYHHKSKSTLNLGPGPYSTGWCSAEVWPWIALVLSWVTNHLCSYYNYLYVCLFFMPVFFFFFCAHQESVSYWPSKSTQILSSQTTYSFCVSSWRTSRVMYLLIDRTTAWDVLGIQMKY